MKKMLLFILAMTMLLCVSCTQSETVKAEKYPPNYDVLASLVGQPRADVLAALELEEEQLTELIVGRYKTPVTVEFAGVSFQLVLGFNAFEDALNGFAYERVYENDPAAAAKDIRTAGGYLSGVMGKTYLSDETLLWELSEKELTDSLSGDAAFGESNYWDLTETATAQQKAYMEHLKETDYWAVYRRDPAYYLDFDVSYLPDTQTVTVALRYSVRQYRRGSGNYSEG